MQTLTDTLCTHSFVRSSKRNGRGRVCVVGVVRRGWLAGWLAGCLPSSDVYRTRPYPSVKRYRDEFKNHQQQEEEEEEEEETHHLVTPSPPPPTPTYTHEN